MAAAEDEEVLAKLPPDRTEVVLLTEVERAAFVDAAAPVAAEWRARFGGRVTEYLA